MRPFVKTLDADVIEHLIGFVSGNCPDGCCDLCCIAMCYNDLESYVMGGIYPDPCPCPMTSPPVMKATAPATRESTIAALESLKGGGHKAVNWATWWTVLQYIAQLISSIPKPTP